MSILPKTKEKEYWSRICRSKEKGGLGIKDLRKQNISLMVKWWWKLETQKGLWQDIVRARYLRNKTVADVTARFSDSPCWKSLLKVKKIYMMGRKIDTKMGNITRLWKDSINGSPALQAQFPQLFEICSSMVMIPACSLDAGLPLICSSSGKSCALRSKTSPLQKVEMVTKSFGGLTRTLSQDAVLTRQVMRGRKWPGNPCCSFCREVCRKERRMESYALVQR